MQPVRRELRRRVQPDGASSRERMPHVHELPRRLSDQCTDRLRPPPVAGRRDHGARPFAPRFRGLARRGLRRGPARAGRRVNWGQLARRPHSAAGGGGRGGTARPLHQVRRMHARLPDQRAAAGRAFVRTGKPLDAGAQQPHRHQRLPAQLHRVRPRLPHRGDPPAQPRREARRRATLHPPDRSASGWPSSTRGAACRGPWSGRASCARRTARSPPRRSM